MRKILLPVAAHALISKTKAFTSRCRACADKPRLHSLESRALTHLESIGLGNAAFISMGGPQAHGNSQPGLDLAIHAVHIASVRHRTLDEQREKFRLDEVAC